MNKPHIILHMTASIDGKVTGDFLANECGQTLIEEYYRINREYNADAFLCGRITMEESFAGCSRPCLTEFDGEDDFNDFVAKRHRYYAVSIDPHGKLNWPDGHIHDEDVGYDDAHVIEVLTHDIPRGYTRFLKKRGISYIFCGEHSLDPAVICDKLLTLFGTKTLMLEGGRYTDTLFASNGLIDELSLVVVPLIESDPKAVDLFAKKQKGFALSKFSLVCAKPLPHNGLWLNYKLK